MVKSKVVGVRITDQLYNELSEYAARQEKSVPEVIRDMIHRGTPDIVKSLQDLLKELKTLRFNGEHEKQLEKLKKLEQGGAVLVDSDELDRIKQNVATLAGMHQLVMPYIRRALQRGRVEATERRSLQEYLTKAESISIN